MAEKKTIFLYEDKGIYYYENAKGKVFGSKRKLHDGDIQNTFENPMFSDEHEEEPIIEVKQTREEKAVADYDDIVALAEDVILKNKDVKLNGGKKASKLSKEEKDIYLEKVVNDFSKALEKKPGGKKPSGDVVAAAFRESVDTLKDKGFTSDDIEEETYKLVKKLEQAAILHQVQHNKRVQGKVLVKSEEKLMNELEIGGYKQTSRLQDALFDANTDALESAGLRKGSPKWLINIAKVTSGFWSIIIVIISFFTLTPITMLAKSIGVQVKSSPLKWTLTTLLYAGIVFLVYIIIIGILLKNNAVNGWWPWTW